MYITTSTYLNNTVRFIFIKKWINNDLNCEASVVLMKDFS